MSGAELVVQTLLFPAKKSFIGLEVSQTVEDSLTFFQRLLHRLLMEILKYNTSLIGRG